MQLIVNTDRGLYCPKGNFYIDPWKPVDNAVITHAHSDHSRWGMKHYLAHHLSKQVMRLRLGSDISVQTVQYGEPLWLDGVRVSLHPAGHIPGSSQVRVEYKGRVEVVSGDYKLEDDGLSTSFECVPCHSFVSECTFGLPIYQWQNQEEVYRQINSWWAANADQGRCSVVMAYSLGKAQRVLAHMDMQTGPVYVHGAVWNTNQALIASGLPITNPEKVTDAIPKEQFRRALIIAPPSALDAPWLRRFGAYRTSVCSGWMNVRGTRRRRSVDTGFVLSDHADWAGLNKAIRETGAEEVLLTHGFTDSFSRYLVEQGVHAQILSSHFQGEEAD